MTTQRITPSKRANRALVGLCAGSIGVLGAIGIAAGIANADEPQADPSATATTDVAPGDRVASIDTLDEDLAEYDACEENIFAGLDEAQLDAFENGSSDELATQIGEACGDLLPIGVLVGPSAFVSEEEDACINDKMGFTAEEIAAQQAGAEYVEVPDDVFRSCVDLTDEELPADGGSWVEFDGCLQAETGIDVPALNSEAYEPGSLTDAEIEALNEAGMECAEELLSPEEFDQYVEAEQAHDQLEADAANG